MGVCARAGIIAILVGGILGCGGDSAGGEGTTDVPSSTSTDATSGGTDGAATATDEGGIDATFDCHELVHSEDSGRVVRVRGRVSCTVDLPD